MTKKTICLVAHDGEPKQELCKFINYGDNAKILSKYNLIGTDATAKMIHEICRLDILSIGHGPSGGDVKIANEILEGRIHALFFFINYDLVQAHQADIEMLVKWTAKKNVIMANNRATADAIIVSLDY